MQNLKLTTPNKIDKRRHMQLLRNGHVPTLSSIMIRMSLILAAVPTLGHETQLTDSERASGAAVAAYQVHLRNRDFVHRPSWAYDEIVVEAVVKGPKMVQEFEVWMKDAASAKAAAAAVVVVAAAAAAAAAVAASVVAMRLEAAVMANQFVVACLKEVVGALVVATKFHDHPGELHVSERKTDATHTALPVIQRDLLDLQQRMKLGIPGSDTEAQVEHSDAHLVANLSCCDL
ncbi:hypothetical protein HG530_004614 [Fusarium avenaceum]|nr:hypothetical protein HG530_004614 [Fusarium avenaceum]